jgi:hypothetical protein
VTSKIIRTARFRDQTLNIALRGLLGKIENKKSSRIRVEDYQGKLAAEESRRVHVNPDSRQCFLDTMTYLTGRGITVMLVYLPTMDLLNEIDPDGQAEVMDIFKKIAAENKNIYFFDYNKDYQHRHELFYDLRHLNGEGNELVTRRMIQDLKDLGL